jgi:hypothetical protein
VSSNVCRAKVRNLLKEIIIYSFRYEYHWADGTTIKKAIKVSAPEYVDYLMTWVQNQLDDETIFPSKIGTIHI